MVKRIRAKSPQTKLMASNPALKSAALREMIVPPVISGLETVEVKLTFRSDLPYVKVKFRFFNEDIRISCNSKVGENCTFEFNFGEKDDHERSFEIRVRRIKETGLEPIEILCFDKNGKQYDQAEQRWILLEPTPKLPSNVILDILLYTWRIFRKWYIRYPLVVITTLIVGVYLNLIPKNINDFVKRRIEHMEITCGVMDPYEFVGIWSDNFIARDDNRPDPSKWPGAPAEWTLADGSPNVLKYKALVVKGPKLGLNKLPDYYALYNFEVSFDILIDDPKGSAAWVLRAEDDENYYMFRLTFPQADAIGMLFEAFSFEYGRPYESLSNTPDTIYIAKQFKAGNVIHVKVRVNENDSHRFEFRHIFEFTRGVDTNDSTTKQPIERVIIDPRNAHKFGNFGFKGRDDEGTMKVEKIMIRPL